MAKEPSDETKIRRGWGQGTGADYKPFISANRFPSAGTCSVIRDWKTGRSVHCLSQGEAMTYYILRWDGKNVDVREQYPLWGDDFSVEATKRIAEKLGVTPPQRIMTTDFLVTLADGSERAYSVKPGRGLSDRTVERLCIEKLYWEARGVPFEVVLKEKLNKTLVANIRLVTEFYDAADVYDAFSAVKHKIAIGEYIIDMEHEVINTAMLKNILKGEGYVRNFIENGKDIAR